MTRHLTRQVKTFFCLFLAAVVVVVELPQTPDDCSGKR